MWTSRTIERQDEDPVVVHAVSARSEDGTWEARCPEMGLSRTAGTREESVAQLEEAVAVEIRRRGTGWRETLQEVEVVSFPVDGGEGGEDGAESR